MQNIRTRTVLLALAFLPLASLAGGDKYEYWDGNCKVKVKQKKGEYKEQRKCKGPAHVQAPAPVYVVPQPVVVAPQPVYVPAPVVDPGVVIQGTFRVK